MFDTLFLSGNTTNLTKILKITRHFFNLSLIERGDTFFSLYGRSLKGIIKRKIAVFAP